MYRTLKNNYCRVLGDGVSGSNTTDNYVDKSIRRRGGIVFGNEKKIYKNLNRSNLTT